MERIKEAVERARQERDAGGIGFGRTGSPGPAPEAGIQDGLGQITYTKTRTIEVPRPTLREKHIVSGFDPCGFTEAFKILSTLVSHKLREHHWTTLAVTSPGEGEGKTLVAINLAISLAMEFQQTALLVEADLRKPSVCDYFGLEPGPGLERLPHLGYTHRTTADKPRHPAFCRASGRDTRNCIPRKCWAGER